MIILNSAMALDENRVLINAQVVGMGPDRHLTIDR
jgi:hypothetical protein